MARHATFSVQQVEGRAMGYCGIRLQRRARLPAPDCFKDVIKIMCIHIAEDLCSGFGCLETIHRDGIFNLGLSSPHRIQQLISFHDCFIIANKTGAGDRHDDSVQHVGHSSTHERQSMSCSGFITRKVYLWLHENVCYLCDHTNLQLITVCTAFHSIF